MKASGENVVRINGSWRKAPQADAVRSFANDPDYASPFSVPCFTPGSLIATRHGPRPVEELRVGDVLLTRDNGFRPVLWVGHSKYNLSGSTGGARLQPILIKANALGNGVPQSDLLVSPDHQMLLTRRFAPSPLATTEMLVPARHLLGQAGILVAPQREVEFVHVLMERHEILLADGAWTESYRPDTTVVRSLPVQVREDLLSALSGRDPLRGPVFEPARESCGADVLDHLKRSDK
ncbi:Hint domain-containing protein [Donghicola sp. XS_ASV15]|uniref:Hint domain-containing protein n=1 Tax=Donghicola sp. XS_ASV15 TaxID=3241295 RepID=UPI003512FDA6